MSNFLFEIENAIRHMAHSVTNDSDAYHCARNAAQAAVTASGKYDPDNRFVVAAARLGSAIYQQRSHEATVQRGTFIPRDDRGLAIDSLVDDSIKHLRRAAIEARLV